MLEGLIILAMLAVNAVFAAYEMALAAVTRARLEALAQLNRRGARSAVWMKTRLERSLAVVQVGITLAGAIAAATGGAGVEENLSPLLREMGLKPSTADAFALTLFVLPLSALTIVFAELVPKMFALGNKELVTLRLSPAMRAISYVFYPAIFILETIVKRVMGLRLRQGARSPEVSDPTAGLLELRAAASVARASRLIGPLEEKIVDAAAQLSVSTLRKTMLPAADIATIPASASLAEALVYAHIHMHTRYPICAEEGNPQTIMGYVNFKDIVAALKIDPGDMRLVNKVRPIPRLDVDTSLASALEQMIRDNIHMVLAVENGGVVVGLVTLENILEQLVGPMGDEYDRLPAHIHPLPVGWIMGGGVRMEAVLKTMGLPAPVRPVEQQTLAEWCQARQAGPLAAEAVLRGDGFEVHVRKIRRHKVLEAVLCRSSPP